MVISEILFIEEEIENYFVVSSGNVRGLSASASSSGKEYIGREREFVRENDELSPISYRNLCH